MPFEIKKRRLEKGFSLLEMLIVIAILMIVGTAIWLFQFHIFSLNNVFTSEIGAQQEGRKALKDMTTEIRPLSLSNGGAYPISLANANSLTIFSDINNDGIKEQVRYFLSGAILKKGVITPAGNPLTYNPASEIVKSMVHDIANGATPIFAYYDSNYDGTTAPLPSPVNIPAVRLIKITLIIDHDPNRPPSPITITTQVSARNLKDNI